MRARPLLALLLILWPTTAHAQAIERPTAIEVAGAMVACLSEGGPGGGLVTASGANSQATIEVRGQPAFFLSRRDPMPARREVGVDYWLDDDPIQPPMVITTQDRATGVMWPIPPGTIACFEREYRHIVRP